MMTTVHSRRSFLRRAGLACACAILPRKFFAFQTPLTSGDEEICRHIFEMAVDLSLQYQPIGKVMAAIGKSFIGTPYRANMLEQPGPEHLVINLRGLDCVTFVENTLALARCIKLGRTDFASYSAQLKLIRYRGGIIDAYPSRLHYFSEWIADNENKGIVRNITREIRGVRYAKTIDFMSTHRSAYPQLVNESFYRTIREIEGSLSTRKLYYIPKEKVDAVAGRILDGDILAITTSIKGLDVSHTGLALHANGVLKYLHAPDAGGTVQISAKPLAGYLASHPHQTGLIVARPEEPEG